MTPTEGLTGRTRHRDERRAFRSTLIVLQVEVVYSDGPNDHDGMPQYLAGKSWRDATTMDYFALAQHVPGHPK